MSFPILDNFVEAADTNLVDHTSDSGDGWVLGGGTWFTRIGRVWGGLGYMSATAAGGALTAYYITTVAPSPDYEVESLVDVLAGDTTDNGILARGVLGQRTAYVLVMSDATISGDMNIWRYSADESPTNLGSASVGVVTPGNHSFRLSTVDEGADVRVIGYWDDVEVINVLDTSVEKLTAAGYPGVVMRGDETNLLFLDFEARTFGPALPTVTLDDPADRSVVQRNIADGNKVVTITGTYSGDVTSVQARVVDDGTTDEVVGWTTIDASPVGGAFSGPLTVPQGGWYNTQVRAGNNTGITDDGANKWGVGAVICTAGQSNMAEWFAEDVAGAANDLLSYYKAAWSVMPAAAQGAVAFGNKFITGLASPIPVAMLDYGKGGFPITEWQPGQTTYDDMLAAVNAVGGEVELYLWSQGETDAVDLMAQATYEGWFSSFITAIRTDIINTSTYPNIPLVVDMLGRYNGLTDVQVQDIRTAQENVVTATANAYHGATKIDLPTRDAVHYTGANYEIVAERMAQCCLFLLGRVSYYRSPQISHYVTNSPTETDVIIAHDNGTDFTPLSNITEFEVLDDGTPVAVSAAVHQTNTTVRLTHAAVAGVKSVRYMYGSEPVITGAVLDNSSLNLPLEFQIDIPDDSPPVPVLSNATQPVYTP